MVVDATLGGAGRGNCVCRFTGCLRDGMAGILCC